MADVNPYIYGKCNSKFSRHRPSTQFCTQTGTPKAECKCNCCNGKFVCKTCKSGNLANCDCGKANAFSCRPAVEMNLEDIQCGDSQPAIIVETYTGGPPSQLIGPSGPTGGTGIKKSEASLGLCDTLQFWSEGTVCINATQGSVQLQIDTENIIRASGDPVGPPPAQDRGFAYLDTDTNAFYIWDGTAWANVSAAASSNDFWQTKSGSPPDGTDDNVELIKHESDICVGRTGTVAVGEGISGECNTRLGTETLLNNIGDGNVAIGFGALKNNTTGFGNVAIGKNAGISGVGSLNVAIGDKAGQSSVGATVAIGSGAGQLQQSDNAIAIGRDAGQNQQHDSTIAIGRFAGQNQQSPTAIAIGFLTGRNQQGSSTIAIGEFAGFGYSGLSDISFNKSFVESTISNATGTTGQGELSIAIGTGAGIDNQDFRAIAIGSAAGFENQSNDSIAIGTEAGRTNLGEASIAIGVGAGTTGENSVILGKNAQGGTTGELVIRLADSINNQLSTQLNVVPPAGISGPTAFIPITIGTTEYYWPLWS